MPKRQKQDSIREWVDSLSDAEARDELEKLTRRLDTLAETVRARHDELRIYLDRTIASLEVQRGPAIPEAHLPATGVPPPVGKSAQVVRAMGQHDRLRVWTAKELRGELIGYGWMTDSMGEYPSLLSTLSRLVKEGAIHRPERGLYCLAPPHEVAAAQK